MTQLIFRAMWIFSVNNMFANHITYFMENVKHIFAVAAVLSDRGKFVMTIRGSSYELIKIWSMCKANCEGGKKGECKSWTFYVHPRFHPTSVEWNLACIQNLPTCENGILFSHLTVACILGWALIYILTTYESCSGREARDHYIQPKSCPGCFVPRNFHSQFLKVVLLAPAKNCGSLLARWPIRGLSVVISVGNLALNIFWTILMFRFSGSNF